MERISSLSLAMLCVVGAVAARAYAAKDTGPVVEDFEKYAPTLRWDGGADWRVADKNVVIDAVGPETFTYRDLVRQIAKILGKRPLVIGVPPRVGYWATAALGKLVGDVMITRQEIKGLMEGLLYVDSPSAGQTKLTDWAKQNARSLGVRYASELARRVNRSASYEDL